MPSSYVIDTSKSSAAKLVPVPVADVKLSPDSFWNGYIVGNRQISIPKLFELFEEKGILDNFRRLTGKKGCPRRGPYFTDSDIFKWMEGAAFALAGGDDPVIRRQLETAITEILPAQCDDGYLNTYFTDPAKRYTDYNAHEMYCAGHYFQAAIAIYRCLGDDRVLKSAIRYADYMYNRFGPQKKEKWFCGHPEIELALVELYRTTGDEKYLHFSRHILDQLNVEGGWAVTEKGRQNIKFTDRTKLFGHAVRNMYMVCAGSDYWAETDNQEFAQTINRLWNNLVNRQIYITGGLGSRYHGEAIGLDYELPNLLAYTETCAAIGFVMWNYRNLNITANANFADWLERSLYNGVLSGISFDYRHYFYMNPLASLGDHERFEWHDCTCCPTNIQRLFASLPGYFYSTDNTGVWTHLYDNSTAKIKMNNGKQITISQQTKYPYDGHIALKINLDQPQSFSLNLRIPGWAESCDLKINGKPFKYSATPGSYLAIDRQWIDGDCVELALPMPIRFVACHPNVTDNLRRVAMMRGPLVYCFEDVDNPALKSVHLAAFKNDFVEVARSANIVKAKVFDRPVTAIEISGFEIIPDESLYRSVTRYDLPTRPVRLTAIPYFAWANRGKSQMTTWPAIL
jgi:DUF1680 family protein